MSPKFMKSAKLIFSEKKKSLVLDIEEDVKNDKASPKSLPVKAKDKVTTPLVYGTVMAIMAGSISSGYNIGSVNTPQNVLVDYFNQTLHDRGYELSENKLNFFWSIAVSILLMGAICGTFLTNLITSQSGRKGSILLASIIGLTSSAFFILSYFLNLVELFLSARFLAGLHAGLASSLVPLYLVEISPESGKNLMGILHNLGLNIGMLSAQILGQDTLLGTSKLWPILLSLSSGFILMALACYRMSPLSPVFLFMVEHKEEKALNVFVMIRKISKGLMSDELALLKEQREKKEKEESSLFKMLGSKQFRRSFALICVLHIGQQFSGINAIFYYSTKIFEDVGMSIKQSQYGSIAAVLTNVISSLIAIPLIKKFSNKSLLLTSTLGTVVTLVGLVVSMKLKTIPWMSFLILGFFIAFVAFFAIGLGPIPFSIPSQLLPQSSVALGMGLGAFSNWSSNFCVALAFPILHQLLDEYVFLVFTGFGILTAILILLLLRPSSQKQDMSKPSDV